jgi:glucokinase
LAEHTFGAGRSDHNLVVIKAGRGIGAGTILNGHLFQGDHSAAGEIGHVVVVEDGQPCRCGKTGCLETVASSEALLREARQLAQSEAVTYFSQFAEDPNQITSDVIGQALEAGDPAALALVAAAAEALGRAVAFVVGILNVRRILLVGTLTRFGQPWFEAVQHAIRCHSMPALATDVDVAVGQLDENVVTLGASALLLTNELGLDLAR